MSKPNITIPTEFATNGVKTDFTASKILNGFDRISPDVLAGDNLNKFIDDTYKGLNGVLELYEGCVLYDTTVTYNNKSLVFDVSQNGIKFYHSLQNSNLNNPLTDSNYWEEVIIDGASRSLNNLTAAGQKVIDGQWVESILNLMNNTAVGTYEFDLSTYLPDSNSNYEVILCGRIQNNFYSTSTGDEFTNIYVRSDLFTTNCPARFLSSSSHACSSSGMCIVPVHQSLTIQRINAGDNNAEFALWGYRRIGTNV